MNFYQSELSVNPAAEALILATRQRRRRWQIFLILFLGCLLTSLGYIFSQPPIYQSLATVLTVAPTDIDQTITITDNQHVNIQKQVLLGVSVLEQTVERLKKIHNDDDVAWSVDDLRSLLTAEAIPETHLLQLRAEGSNPRSLQRVVNAWIDSYLDARANFIHQQTVSLTVNLADEVQRIAHQVDDKRHQIDQFQQQTQIVSAESADNQIHARLQGLNTSLNNAMTDAVKTKAKLDAVREALSQGKNIALEADTQTLAVLTGQAEKLREKLAELQAQYTPQYIDLNPNLRRVKEQLAEIESKLAEKISDGKRYAEQEAEKQNAAAQQTVAAIQADLARHQKLAAHYTQQFSQYQALQQELQNLEALQQTTLQRQAELDVRQQQHYPQVDVVDWASLPEKPVRPIYWQEASLAVIISLLIALSVVVIVDYLNRESQVSSPLALSQVHLHATPHNLLNAVSQTSVLTAPEARPVLSVEYETRELVPSEIDVLYHAANASTQWVILLLMNGLSIADIVSLDISKLDLSRQSIQLSQQRTLPMSRRLIQRLDAEGLPADIPGLEAIEAGLCGAAIDGKLANPDQIQAEILCHSYRLFLIRQGLKLTELSKITGVLTPNYLLALSRFSPAQSGRAIDTIQLDYFQAFSER